MTPETSTTPTTPKTKEVECQKTFFDLDTFKEVTLKKLFQFAPVSSIEDAAARLGNDSTRLLAIVNEGLQNEQRRIENADPTGWHTLTDEGDLNGEFTGTPADQKAVNSLVLTLAKTVFGYDSNGTLESRQTAKKAAMNMISNNPDIREGLKKSAALKIEED